MPSSVAEVAPGASKRQAMPRRVGDNNLPRSELGRVKQLRTDRSPCGTCSSFSYVLVEIPTTYSLLAFLSFAMRGLQRAKKTSAKLFFVLTAKSMPQKSSSALQQPRDAATLVEHVHFAAFLPESQLGIGSENNRS